AQGLLGLAQAGDRAVPPPGLGRDRPVDPRAGGQGVGQGRSPATPGPPLCTVTPNPMGSPASTGEASAVLVMARLGQFTVMEAEGVGAGPELVAETEAVLG